MQNKKINGWAILGHLVAWSIAIWFLTSANLSWQFKSTKAGDLQAAMLYGMAFNALLFYINAFWCIPKKLIPHNFSTYFNWALLLLVLVTGIETLIDVMYTRSLGLETTDLITNTEMFIVFSLSNLGFHIVFLGLSFAYQSTTLWLKTERRQKALEKEKLLAELKYLKAQLNPHFLFNGINSVYHLIDPAPEKAKDTLLQLSNLLRHQLYECNDDFIPLEKEMAYLDNYINLEKTRKGQDAFITNTIKIKNPTLHIAPLLLTPFVENAFKYLSHHDEAEKNKLSIEIINQENLLKANIRNTFTKATKDNKGVGGIGIQNTRRRLELIYPNKHQLDIKTEGDTFNVQLQINLL